VRLNVEVDHPGVAALCRYSSPPRGAHGNLVQRLPPHCRGIHLAAGGIRIHVASIVDSLNSAHLLSLN
jgi:hypothetical protein